MRNKRMMANVLVMTMVFQSMFGNFTVHAVEVSESPETAEYIVQVKNEETLEDVLEEKAEDVVLDSDVEELKEQQMTVLELTEKEAEELLEEKNIVLVEENVIVNASTIEMTEPPLVSDEKDATSTESETIEDITILDEDTLTVESTLEKDIAEENTTEETITEDKKSSNKKKTSKEKSSKKNNNHDKNASQEKKQSKLDRKNMEENDASNLQWNLEAINLSDENVGKDIIKVALIDSGVSYDDDISIASRITISNGLETENVLFDDTTGHGTGLAGIIVAQDNKNGIHGINPSVEMYSIQILDENNQTTLSNLIAAIYKAVELECNIINMSLGTNVESELLHSAICDAYDAGVLMVAAAGNTEGGAVEYPAAYQEVLAVSATDTMGNKAVDSCDGEEIEIFAPGTQIPTTGLFGGISVVEGTSVAAAQVTGAASLIWSIDKEKSAGFVRSLLVNTAQAVKDNGNSQAGLVDIQNAIQQYAELSNIYVEEKTDYKSIQTDNQEAKEYLDVELVNGSWNGTSHAEMVSNALSYYNIKSQYVQLMQTCARLADDAKYKEASYLHGTHNYVKGLKFLYQCAGYLRSGKSINTSLEKAASDAKLNTSKENDNLLIEKTRLLLKTDVLSGVEESSAGARYYKVIGFAMHLVGDVYAHRTIVPEYTVAGTNSSTYKSSTKSTSYDAKFGTGNFKSQSTHSVESNDTLKKWAYIPVDYNGTICKHWKCFQKTVKLGCMEFRDIYHYSTTNTRSIYEDNPNFCKERYVDAKFMCEVLFDESYTKEEFHGIIILFPTEKHVKLNNLRGYAKNMGEDISLFTTEEWEEISTLEAY